MKSIHLLATFLFLGSIAGSAGCSRNRMLAWQNRSEPAATMATAGTSPQPEAVAENQPQSDSGNAWGPARFAAAELPGNPTGTIENEVALVSRSTPRHQLAPESQPAAISRPVAESGHAAETMVAAVSKPITKMPAAAMPAAFSMRAPSTHAPAMSKLATASAAGSTPAGLALPTLTTLKQGQDLNTTVGESSGTVVLDFYADWCGPCRTQGKILHELESVAAANQVRIIKVNVDDHPQLARRMKVASLPTLMRLEDGQIVDRRTGLADKRTMTTWMH